MEKYLAVLGRQPLISIAELESLFGRVRRVAPALAEFEAAAPPDIRRLGGTLKIARPLDLATFAATLPDTGKITLGVSDFSPRATAASAGREALRLKRQLVKQGRSVRVVPNQTAVISSATSLHNHLFAPNKIEIIKHGRAYYRVIALSNIESYARRDRERPARDARVGMLPPKLAQILINLCGPLPAGTRLLDPFCGTGVLLQEAVLMGYTPYGTDLSERMIDYAERNLAWLAQQKFSAGSHPSRANQENATSLLSTNRGHPDLAVADATSFTWSSPIGAVACEAYLGPPMSQPPAEIKLREAKQTCRATILGFLKNLSSQIASGTPVVVAVPAWLRPDGHYDRLNLLDEIDNLRYNVHSFKNLGQNDLLYHRDGQVVAREIIVLRKK